MNQAALEPDAPQGKKWYTIMAYPTQLYDAGDGAAGGVSRMRFSNPDQIYNGDPLGVSGDEPSSSITGPADARRTLNETRAIIANFRVAPRLKEGDRVHLQANNGQFFSAEHNGGSTVRADSDVAGAWETFTLSDRNGGCAESGDQVWFHTSDGFYLHADLRELPYSVDADWTVASNSSNFTMHRKGGGGAIRNGDFVAFNGTWSYGYYMRAENGGGGRLLLDSDSDGPWDVQDYRGARLNCRLVSSASPSCTCRSHRLRRSPHVLRTTFGLQISGLCHDAGAVARGGPMGAQSMELTTSDRPATAVVDIRVGACRALAQGGVPQATVRRSEPFAHHSRRWTASWAPVVRTVLGLLLILSSGSVGRAVDRVRVETGVDKAVAALGVSGAGVIVAILDRGIDWESNDFRNRDGTTRIAYIFDMCDEAGADDVENSYGRGTIYTRRQIDRALAAGTTLATRDAFGHGTTTTGIAAGNGRNSLDRKYRGVAPNATIIAVKIVGGEGGNEPDCWAGHSGISVAMDFVVDKARELAMPVVMLANVGSIGGPTDGTSAMARKIDATVGPDRPGVVFVTGTGDDGVPSKTQNRAAGDVPNGGTLDVRFALDTGAGYLEVWYDRNQGFDVSVITPAGRLGPYPPSQFEAAGVGVHAWHYRGGDDGYGAANSKRLLYIHFDGGAGAGDYTLRLENARGSARSGMHFDASLNTPFGKSGRFLNHVTPGSIWDGATAFRNVAPNSYVIRTRWTDIDGMDRGLFGEGDVGELWTGSSVGPTVDGRIGVTVSAPGDRIVTTYAPRSYWASFRHLLIDDGGGLYGMAGAVSAAAPVVTGIIALMLEVDPTLDAVSVQRVLQETARTDEFTGQTPNTLWGYGKVDAFEALMAVRRESTERSN